MFNDTISVATYNFEDFGSGKSPAATAALARTLRRMNADVVAFQEVKDQATLDQFVTLDLADQYPYRVVFPTRGSRQNTGVMSRYPITHTDESPVFLRAIGAVELDVPHYPLRLYVAHLKADPYFGKPHTPEQTRQARQERAAEVAALHDVVARDMRTIPHRHYVVCGDMNTPPDTPEIQGLFDPASRSPLADPMAGRDGPGDQSHPSTHHRYDYVLVAPAMLRDVASVGVYPGEAGASDHLPVLLTLHTMADLFSSTSGEKMPPSSS